MVDQGKNKACQTSLHYMISKSNKTGSMDYTKDKERNANKVNGKKKSRSHVTLAFIRRKFKKREMLHKIKNKKRKGFEITGKLRKLGTTIHNGLSK